MYTAKKKPHGWGVYKDRDLMASCGMGHEAEADATHIARALNRDAAMGEVREALASCITEPGAACMVSNKPDWMTRRINTISDRARQALAALDAAGKGE